VSGYPHTRGEACDCPRCMEAEQERRAYEDADRQLVHGPCAWCGDANVDPGESLCRSCKATEAETA
jgi:hypothetical protein